MSNQEENQLSALEFDFEDSEWGNLDIYRFQLIQVCKFSLFLQNIIKNSFPFGLFEYGKF